MSFLFNASRVSLLQFKLLRSLPVLLVAVSGMIVNAAFAANAADLSNLVVTGDSLTAGYQNSQLIQSSQIHGYANIIATQAGVDLNQPLLPAPGYPQIQIEGGFATVVGLNPIPRLNNLQTRDVAVPGLTMAAMVGYQAVCNGDPTNPLYPIQVMAAEILNPNCLSPAPTELAEAAALQPSTSILWIGSNDVLFPILFGGSPTDLATFGQLYQIASSTMAHASGHMVIANIPDVTKVPYLTSIQKLANIMNVPVLVVELKLGLRPGDMVTPYAFPLIEAMGTSLTPLPESIAQGPVIIRAAKVLQIRASVLLYNSIIAYQATINHAALVDIYTLVNNLTAKGIVVNGQKLTTDFMGGLYSLDGIHPTNTGYAIIANEFIRTMNHSLGTDVPPVSVNQVAETDPLIFPDSNAVKATSHVSKGMADALRALMR